MNDFNNLENNNTCPGCPRHCNLSAPSCPRGQEYARTGEVPVDAAHDHGHRAEHRHGGRHGEGQERPGRYGERKHSEGRDGGRRGHHRNLVEHPHYAEMDIDGKLSALLQELGFQRRFSPDGKAGQTRILRILSKNGAMSQRELTEQLGIQPGSASEILGKLEKAGLLQRQPDEGDRRTFTVALTEEGAARAASSESEQSESVHRAFSVLNDEEKAQLLQLTEKLYRSWSEQRKGHGCHRGHHEHE